MKMASNGDCLTRQDWCVEMKEEENLPNNNRNRVGQKDESVQGNGAHYGQGKEKSEEELTRLTLVMSENQQLLRNILTDMQETDDELRLILALIRTDLEKSSTESLLSKEMTKKSGMEQEIMTNLTELVEGQEEIKLKLSDQSQIEDLTKIVETMALKQTEQERKPVLKCYWCREEGHLKRNCPRRINERWIQSQAFRQYPRGISKGGQPHTFKQGIAFRHKHNVDEMHKGISMSWPVDRGNDTEVTNMEQSKRENAVASYNPLN